MRTSSEHRKRLSKPGGERGDGGGDGGRGGGHGGDGRWRVEEEIEEEEQDTEMEEEDMEDEEEEEEEDMKEMEEEQGMEEVEEEMEEVEEEEDTEENGEEDGGGGVHAHIREKHLDTHTHTKEIKPSNSSAALTGDNIHAASAELTTFSSDTGPGPTTRQVHDYLCVHRVWLRACVCVCVCVCPRLCSLVDIIQMLLMPVKACENTSRSSQVEGAGLTCEHTVAATKGEEVLITASA
ncbi:hypothetical protein NHX12_019843 [Muraenolepis orangiensis]|uniref:Uncharacterized protein n=1 Tax=Muraenolepis orangiensis TaxID=630683 RepID=A0A9Q0EU66_9TELE|nr:hypothetical protein NHX12_019843 [Muraenolepis orangiensis]